MDINSLSIAQRIGELKWHLEGIDVFNITELAQMAIGEAPPHRITQVTDQLRENIMKIFSENPSLLSDRYVIENGEVKKL